MAGNRTGSNNNDMTLVIVSLVGFFFVLLAIMWFAASPIIGLVYKWVRTIESLGIWAIIPHGWGRYFWTTPARTAFQFKSIYVSSVPFNLLFALTIAGIGALAFYKVRNQHLDAQIKNDSPIGYKELMELQAPIFPANDFFLLFSLEKYPLKKGPARLPMTAIEFLTDCDALIGIHDTLDDNPRAKKGWMIDEAAVTKRLTSVFGPANPFTNPDFKMSSRSKLQEAVDAIPWHLVSLVYVCLLRLYALEVYVEDDKAFAEAYALSDEHLKNIWRDLNALKRKHGDTLTLGFVDADDEELQRAILKEKKADAILRTLPEVLNDRKQITRQVTDENGQTTDTTVEQTTGDAFKTTVTARENLLKILTCTTGAFDRPEWKKKNPGPTEAARLRITRKRQKQFLNETAYKLLTRNGYLFGMISTLLTQTRSCGILPPATFRWMRFYDYPMWCFLRATGMNTPTVEIAGMFDHAQVEQKSGVPFRRPYLTTSVEGIRLEANKYITEDMRQSFATIQTSRAAATRTVEAARIMAKTIAENIRNRDLTGLDDVDKLDKWQNEDKWNGAQSD
ncbi:secretion/conjugation apparatus DotM-related subunit [Acetobacter malorum]|uniref:secretion/conjugation apparatus DotM-related subunit n=2 Tax=Acetobacter malorum TaxID=178901 RepID=UPI00142E77F5|nr:hypothetical protein [Acetobacter malorum]